jgi:hypothetical protein
MDSTSVFGRRGWAVISVGAPEGSWVRGGV